MTHFILQALKESFGLTQSQRVLNQSMRTPPWPTAAAGASAGRLTGCPQLKRPGKSVMVSLFLVEPFGGHHDKCGFMSTWQHGL